MSTASADPLDAQAHKSFFRQSGWMMIATVASGAFMFAVHVFSKKIPDSEYGVFGTLLSIIGIMQIPGLGLQMVLAQQSASAITDEQRRQVSATARAVLLWTFLLWTLIAITGFIFRNELVQLWKISNPMALYGTILIGLLFLWLPIMLGLLQGMQNFLWMGWCSIFNGLGRFISVSFIVLVLGGYAAGAITGALIGMLTAVLVGAWHCRKILTGPGAAFDRRAWFRRIIPLTLGMGAGQFLLTADVVVVQSMFDKDQTAFYVAVATLGRAIVLFTGPLASVMFPKIVHSVARSEGTHVMHLTLIGTAILGALAGLGMTLFPQLPFLVFKPEYIKAAPLLTWFAWIMLPLAVGNVLVNNLLARNKFSIVPWLVIVAVGYGVALAVLTPGFAKAGEWIAFKRIIQTLGAFNLLLLIVAAWFTWRIPKPRAS